MKLMYEAFVGGGSLGVFANADAAQRRIEQELTNDPTMSATIKLTYFGDEHEAVKPKRPTVADTGWRDEYRGMWAEHKVTNRVFLMLDDDGERVRCFDSHSNMWGVKNEALIPRPDLAPVSLTTHPAYLETLEDYQNAPVGTVVSYRDAEIYASCVKDGSGEWAGVGIDNYDYSAYLASARRRVLYWPEEEE